MPRVIVTDGAARGLERCRVLLAEKSPQAAIHAGLAIEQHFSPLETNPAIARPLEDLPELRELVIPFGDSGNVVLYHHELASDRVLILAFRHQKEAGH